MNFMWYISPLIIVDLIPLFPFLSYYFLRFTNYQFLSILERAKYVFLLLKKNVGYISYDVLGLFYLFFNIYNLILNLNSKDNLEFLITIKLNNNSLFFNFTL